MPIKADDVATTTRPPAVGRAIDELPELFDGFARLVRAGLGITAFGVQIMELPPDYVTESHDESDTGQQELYVALRGSGAVVAGDEELALDGEHLVRVDAGRERVLRSDGDGLRVLCVGAAPGRPYAAPEWTEGVSG
jgi:mannose-6-phosphate isomerase-like protein (cupin superfamily)